MFDWLRSFQTNRLQKVPWPDCPIGRDSYFSFSCVFKTLISSLHHHVIWRKLLQKQDFKIEKKFYKEKMVFHCMTNVMPIVMPLRNF